VESSSSGTPIVEHATSSVYTGTNDVTDVADAASATSGIETTSDAYTFYSGTTQIEQDTNVASGRHRSETPAIPASPTRTAVVYDQYGNMIWQKDANGAISYTAYDVTTGAVIESIQDVNTSSIPEGSVEASTLPSGWTTPDIAATA